MATTVFDVLRKKLRDEIASASAMLESGGVKDFNQYKDATGFIRGLNTALREIEDLARNLERYEDE